MLSYFIWFVFLHCMTTGRQHLHHEFTWKWTDKYAFPYYQCCSCHCPSKADVFSHLNVCLICDHCLIRFLSDYSTIPHVLLFSNYYSDFYHKCIGDFLPPSPLSLRFPVSCHLLATAPSFLTLFNEFQDSFIPFLIYSSLSLQLLLRYPSGFPIV